MRGDYSARLKTITDQLIARIAVLKTHVEQLTQKLAQYDADAQRFRDVRAESEVRMQVGELSVTDWNAKARECDEGVAKIGELQTAARASLAQAREILSMVSGGNRSGPQRAAHAPTPPRLSRPVSAVEGLQTNAQPNGGSSPSGKHKLNELEFLNTVVGNQPQGNGATAPPAEAKPEGAPELSETLLERVTQAQKGSLRQDNDADSLLKGVGNPAPNKPQPLAANVTEQNPIELKPAPGGVERHKTLKCGECSTMNYPTEWYCERCGAELRPSELEKELTAQDRSRILALAACFAHIARRAHSRAARPVRRLSRRRFEGRLDANAAKLTRIQPRGVMRQSLRFGHPQYLSKRR